MGWDYTGMRVWGLYLDMFPISGRVAYSRVAYGSRVVHQVHLDKPITVFGALRTSVSLDHAQIQRIADNNSVA